MTLLTNSKVLNTFGSSTLGFITLLEKEGVSLKAHKKNPGQNVMCSGKFSFFLGIEDKI